MGDATPSNLPVRLDPVCDRFEAAWLSGGRPLMEDFLPLVAEADRLALLRELLALELEYRARQGETPTAEEYRRRLPEHAALVEEAFAVPPVPPALPGYELLGELGRGGMGVVYKARQLSLNRVVALKMILDAGHAGPEALARFRAEAEALARLQHPHIVQVFEVGEHDGRPFFSMEYCPGGGLDRKLAGTPLSPTEAAQLVEVLARAVDAAHQQKVIHRDLKPANVLLAADGVPKIADFGLAKIGAEGIHPRDAAGRTRSGATLGTPSYMAPEQASGKTKQIGPAADVYALGAVLYECLTGRPPFKAAAPLETLLQVVSDDPLPPRQLQPKTPHDLETICLKCLQKDPARRYGTAALLAEDLGRFRRGQPIAARPVSRWERGWRWCKRNPALAGALAAVLLASTTGATVSSTLAVLAGRRAEEAVKARGQADEEKANTEGIYHELQKSNDRLLTSNAHSILRPLGQQVEWLQPPLTDPEIDALWELASSPESTLHVRFIKEALRAPGPTRQLKERAAFALQAAVGLDVERRSHVQYLLAQQLQTDETPPDQQRDVALTLAGFGVQDRAVAAKAVQALLRAMARKPDPVPLRALARGVAALAPRLSPTEAAAACGQAATALTEVMNQATDPTHLEVLAEGVAAVAPWMEPTEAAAATGQAAADLTRGMARTPVFTALQALAPGLSAVAPWLGPKEAADAAADLVREMARTGDLFQLPALAQGLSAVAPRLGPKEAADTAAALTQAIARTTNPVQLQALAQGLASVAPRLERSEAAESCGQGAAVLTRVMDTANVNEVQQLIPGLSALAPELGPQEAGAAAAALTRAMSKLPKNYQLSALAQALSAEAARMEPTEGASILIGAMTQVTDGFALRALADGLSLVAPRLVRQEAGEAAAAIVKAMNQATDAYQLWALARGLAPLAARLGPREAAAVCDQAVAAFIRGMSKTTNGATMGVWAEGLSAAGSRLEPHQAGEAAAILTQAMKNTTDPVRLGALAGGLAALAARMGPRDAATACGQAADALIQTMNKIGDAAPSPALIYGLAALAPRLEPEAASAACGRAADALSRAMNNATDAFALQVLAQNLTEMAPWLGPKQAGEAAAALIRAMSKVTDPFGLQALARGVAKVAPQLDPKEAATACGQTAATLTRAMLPTITIFQMRSLAEGVAAVAPWMEPTEAAAACGQAAALLAHAMSRSRDPGELQMGAWGLAAAAARMDPKEAAAALMRAMAQTNDAGSLPVLEQGLSATFAGVSLDETQQRAAAVVAVVGPPADGRAALGGWPALQPALRPLPSGLPTPQLVELLKHPLCVGPARRAVLDQLGWRYGRRFEDQWDFVQFAEERQLGLDFARPPQPPDAGR